MGFFDMFKKKEEDTPKEEPAIVKDNSSEAKEITVKFGSKTPVPFNDPVYRSIFINYIGEAVLSSKNPDINIKGMEDILSQNIVATVGMTLLKLSFCYKDFATQNDVLARAVSTSLTDYSLKSFKLLSFEPDEMSKGMVDKIDSMKQML